jgi:hypothetical protein
VKFSIKKQTKIIAEEKLSIKEIQEDDTQITNSLVGIDIAKCQPKKVRIKISQQLIQWLKFKKIIKIY